jgi:LacI family transcriptional regulator
LSRHPKASKKTIERIMRIAEEINYYPDLLAKGLRNRRTFTIGLILNDLNNPFYTEILGTVGEVLMRQGYSLLISYSQYNAEQEKVNIRTMLSKRVDGIIISPISSNSPNIAMLRDCGLAFVLIDCYPPAPDVNCVYSEHRDGAILATEHLIAKGHRDILLFTGPANVGLSSRFIQGYRETLERRGIPIRDELIIEASGLSMSAGYEAFKGVLTDSKTTNHAEFTAVVTCSDLLAIGIYKVANDL